MDIDNLIKGNDLAPTDIVTDEATKAKIELIKEQVAEQKQRRGFRDKMYRSFLLLLSVQHVFLISLIIAAVVFNFVVELQPLLAVIVPATLGETYAIIKVMVTFVFSPGDFKAKVEKTDLG